jgi:RNA polymerase sigma-70 factor (ECF subfamily)
MFAEAHADGTSGWKRNRRNFAPLSTFATEYSSIVIAAEKLMETALTSALGTAAQNITAEEFDAIVRRHQRRVHRFLLMLLRDAEEADNLTQECFLRAYQNLGSFRGESSLESWLLRIATNLARDQGRSRKVSFWKRLLGLDGDQSTGGAELLPSGQASPERVLLARENVRAVWEVTNELSQQQRAVFLLRFVEEMELHEIASAMGLQVGSVKTHLFRAVQTVRSKLRDLR